MRVDVSRWEKTHPVLATVAAGLMNVEGPPLVLQLTSSLSHSFTLSLALYSLSLPPSPFLDMQHTHTRKLLIPLSPHSPPALSIEVPHDIFPLLTAASL